MNILDCLVPRPSHRPVFDRLQYAKTEGEAWYIYHVNDISVYLGYGNRQRGGGVPHQKNELEARLRLYLVVSAPTAGVANVLEAKKHNASGSK